MVQTKLSLKARLNLTINPVIHSFIEFLPLGKTEFIENLKKEVESNPMLEIEDQKSSDSEKTETDSNLINNRFDRSDPSILSRWEEDGFLKSTNKLDKNTAIELFTSSEKTLQDHLMEQASTTFNKKELSIASYIIYSLNENGYMDVEIESIASSLGTTPEEIERIRNEIKSFNPVGVAAKSLSECLLAQVENPEDKLKVLIANHLDDLAKSKYELILDKMKITNTELSEMIVRLKKLNPRPGAQFERIDIDYAQIDLLLIKQGDEYVVKYIDEGIPRLSLSSYYDQMLGQASDKKTKSYLKDRVRNANLFIDGIELRKSMILRIAEYLVKVQRDFLDFGEKWKKPLTMKEVSNELGFSESSVSRTVNNKFMASDKGIISLKSFFSHGIKGEFGFVHSVETIKDKIKKIVDEEPRDKPFSDQQISQKMQELGITISRRTIRNYRTEMNILSSSKRKQEYNLIKE